MRGRGYGQPQEHPEACLPGWLLDREQLWLDMLEDRNRSSHVYNAEMAREIFGRLPSHYRELRERFERLKRRMAED